MAKPFIPEITRSIKDLSGKVQKEFPYITMDLLPTLLDFIGQKPSAKIMDGVSIKDNLLNQTNLPERDDFFSFKNKSFIRSGDWKLICQKEATNTKIELFNLSEDLSEKNDLSAGHPELVNKLNTKLAVWEKEVKEGVTIIAE